MRFVKALVFSKYSNLLPETWLQNGIMNLKRLPVGFHGNHPAYNTYVLKRLNALQVLNADDLIKAVEILNIELRHHIRDAYKLHKNTGGLLNLNDYFKMLNLLGK